MREDFWLEILKNILSIVSSTKTVGKIVVQHLVNTRYCESAVVQRLTTSRSGEEGDVITIVVQVHGVAASVHLLHRTTWVAPEGNGRLENYFSHFINWQVCQELISLIVFEHQPFLVHPKNHIGLFQVHLVRPAHLWSLTTSPDQICNWKIISDSSSCLFSLRTETTWSKSHLQTSTDSGQLGPNLKNNLGLGLFVRESALALVESVGAPRTAAADF